MSVHRVEFLSLMVPLQSDIASVEDRLATARAALGVANGVLQQAERDARTYVLSCCYFLRFAPTGFAWPTSKTLGLVSLIQGGTTAGVPTKCRGTGQPSGEVWRSVRAAERCHRGTASVVLFCSTIRCACLGRSVPLGITCFAPSFYLAGLPGFRGAPGGACWGSRSPPSRVRGLAEGHGGGLGQQVQELRRALLR